VNRIHAPDGTQLVYDAYEPAHPPAADETAVLLFHGWGEAAERWNATAGRLLAATFPAYALDQRGHGRSGGRRVHLSRFSQLLGDLQAFRRAVRRRRNVPQLLVGHGVGGLIVLRYLETQPGEPPVGAVVANPALAPSRPAALRHRLATRFADLWPTLRTGSGEDLMTAGARAELQWARRAVLADRERIESPLLVLGDPDAARGFADAVALRSEDALAEALISFARRIRSIDHHPGDD
jgi:alpha-beta hydrolase superfamily lysophospholipase